MLSKINNDTEKFEIVPNIIFEDDIKPTSQENVFENREGNTYFMWPSYNGRMLHKILKNKIIIIDGYYRGLFSFKYKMNKIRLIVV